MIRGALRAGESSAAAADDYQIEIRRHSAYLTLRRPVAGCFYSGRALAV
jgi:hypothetical protein